MSHKLTWSFIFEFLNRTMLQENVHNEWKKSHSLSAAGLLFLRIHAGVFSQYMLFQKHVTGFI